MKTTAEIKYSMAIVRRRIALIQAQLQAPKKPRQTNQVAPGATIQPQP